MADIKWIKITTDIFDDEKIKLIESMPDSYAIIVCWFKLLCFAGKQNNNGVFMMNDRIAYTDEMLATIFRMNLNTVKLSLGVFENFGMIVVSDNVISIKNWNKYQSMKDKQSYNEYMANYMKERYHKQKQLAAGGEEIINKNLNKNINNFNSQEERNKNKEKRIKNEEERSKNKEEDTNNKADKPADTQSVLDTIKNAELIDALNEFIKYRKEIKHPVTPHALKLLIDRLGKLATTDKDKIEILNQSMVNGWQGVFALDRKQQSNPRTEHYDKMDKSFMNGEIV